MKEREIRREAPSSKPAPERSEPGRARPAWDEDDEDPIGKTPGSAEAGGLDDAEPERSAPGKTPGNAEG